MLMLISTTNYMKQLLISLFALLALALPASAGDFTTGENTFLLNGKPFVVTAAELHYPRIPRQYWEHRIRMCKALGMNTICMYVFWNIHEQREGQFDFTGNNDIAAFCRLAKKCGMYVIVRPGPYVCAEWEMGGLPWWLLKKRDIRLREMDPYFIERVRIFEQKVGEQLAPLTIQKGGPIIMVQVENEYGSYGESKEYVAKIRDIVRASGFDKVALFQCDWASNFTKNGLDDLTWTMNFGTGANIDEQFRRLGELRPTAPKMCSEFWSGWFDKWGAHHETRSSRQMNADIDEMLSKGISLSLYMTHGGTSFGHWAGANSPGFAPDVTSYDYDAPINEWGAPTPKYYELQAILAKHGAKTSKAPAAPAKLITVPNFRLTEYAPIEAGIDSAANADLPLAMEQMDMGWGMLAYTCRMPATADGATLTIDEAHDYAQVWIDDKYIGKLDRVKHEKTLRLPAQKGGELRILVEAMGRINFGRAIKDFKGIVGNVYIDTRAAEGDLRYTLRGWRTERMPDTYANTVRALTKSRPLTAGAALPRGYYRGSFNLTKTGDTFLDMHTWGKGQVWVNGHALGRFWRIGPQQTLYLPGCWLKKGRNEVIVLDITGPEDNTCAGQAKHQVDMLQAETTAVVAKTRPSLTPAMQAAAGELRAGNGWQHIAFAPKTGRHIAIECLTAQDAKTVAAIAELYATDKAGTRLSREAWTVAYASSEDMKQGNNNAEKAYDLQESTYWQTAATEKYPHLIVIDLGAEQTVAGIDILPRAEQGAPHAVKGYKVFVY